MMERKEIIIPKGLKKVECIISEHDYWERERGKLIPDWIKDRWKERFTVGKVYPCKVGKTGKVLIVRADDGKVQIASYCYFKPAEITKRRPKTIKKMIAARLIKILKKV